MFSGGIAAVQFLPRVAAGHTRSGKELGVEGATLGDAIGLLSLVSTVAAEWYEWRPDYPLRGKDSVVRIDRRTIRAPPPQPRSRPTLRPTLARAQEV